MTALVAYYHKHIYGTFGDGREIAIEEFGVPLLPQCNY
jgi:hypothetical protein